jgi:phospholipid/cholesterol/gamma-HCH transport system substrate-binding protein
MQKRSTSNEIKAGIFVLISVLLLLALFLKVSGTLDMLTRDTYHLRARFSNVLGVGPNTRVTVDGVGAGRVISRDLVKNATSIQVELVFEVDQAIGPIYKDALAVITSETLLSQKSVDIYPGTPGKTQVQEGDIIHGVSAPDINATLAKVDETVAAVRDLVTDQEIRANIKGIFSEANSLLTDLRGVSANVKEIVAENRGKVGSVLDNVEVTSENIRELSEQIKQGVSRLESDLRVLVSEDLHRLVAEDAHGLIGDVRGVVAENREDIRSAVKHARRTLESISENSDKILADLKNLSAMLNDTASDNREEIDRLIKNLEHTSANARRFSKQLADYPWQLIYPSEKRRQTRGLYPAWQPEAAPTEGQQEN